jgi:hypothetical protein
MSGRARLAAIGCGTLTVLAATTACTPTGTSASGGASATPSGSFFTAVAPGSSASPSASPSASASASPSATPATTAPVVIGSPSPSASPSPSQVPIGAPSTGGGGTAGVQDILLFGLGGAALLAGAGSLAYRRRAMRDR